MHLAELWRYPVKSLAGERLREADVRSDGVHGDRLAVVHDARGQLVTARTRPGLLGLRAQTGAEGEPLVDGLLWSSPAAAAAIAVEKLCERCVVTTIHPDTQAIDADVLRRIRTAYGARFALNCHVAEPGRVAVGDPVELLS